MLAKHVEHYLDFVGQKKGASADVINTYCWFDGSTLAPVAGRSCIHGTYKNVIKWYKELERQKVKLPTLHITLNETDFSGRRTENIKSYRVLCCDLDREVGEDELLEIYESFKVQMVVRSSKGKYHLYWQLERGSDLEVWRKFQLGMASKLRGDLALSLPTSMIRVPGFTRIDKNDATVMPSVLTFPTDNKVWPLRIKQVVKLFPWIWEEAEKGEKKLKAERSRAAKIAHQLIKARGTEYDGLKFARQTPNVGRNTTLYFTVKETVVAHEETLTLSEAMSFGEEINEAFPEPLGAIEARNTITSAWNKGLVVRKWRRERQRELVGKLEPEPEKVEIAPKGEKIPDVKEHLAEALIPPDKPRICGNYLDISNTLVEMLWTSCGSKGEQAANHNVLASAYQTKYYKKLTDFMIVALKRTGAFKVSGYSVYLRGRNEAGRVVRYRKNLDGDALAALLQDIFSRLYLHAVKYSLNGHAGSVEDSMGYLHEKEKSQDQKQKECEGRD